MGVVKITKVAFLNWWLDIPWNHIPLLVLFFYTIYLFICFKKAKILVIICMSEIRDNIYGLKFLFQSLSGCVWSVLGLILLLILDRKGVVSIWLVGFDGRSLTGFLLFVFIGVLCCIDLNSCGRSSGYVMVVLKLTSGRLRAWRSTSLHGRLQRWSVREVNPLPGVTEVYH